MPPHLRPTSGRCVLVGVDGSPAAADAIALADAVAGPLGASIEFAFIHPEATSYEPAFSALLRCVAETTREQMHDAGLDLGVSRPLRLVGGACAATGLAALARSLDAALVIAGSTSRGRLGRIHPGSTGRRLLGQAACPVAVAPRGYVEAGTPLTPIGAAHDGSPEAVAALVWARELAQASGANLKVLTVHEALAFGHVPVGPGLGWTSANDALLQQCRDELTRIAGSAGAEPVLLHGDPAAELLLHSRELGLLVAGSRSHGRLGSLLLGSVCKELVHESACPVVIAPP